MAHRGSDDTGVVATPPVVLGFRTHWTTNEARGERQPIPSIDGRLLLAYDGRVDNREELADRLGLAHTASDGVLLVELLAREGWTGLSRTVGEFALACWDAAGRRLWLARDSLGMRSLYYAVTAHGVAWASELQAVFLSTWVARRPNEGFIAEYLALAPHTLEETAFEDVQRLPQAHVLEVVDGRAVARRYWEAGCREARRLAEPQAAEEFRCHLSTAVRACLRASRPVAFQVSGGLDSSTVIGLACAAGIRRPAAYSMVYPDDPRADESPYIDAVVRSTGARSRRVQRAVPARQPFDYALRHDDLPYIATGEPLLGVMLQRAAADGHDVMLTGLGGDHWLTPSLFRLADLIRRGRAWAAVRYGLALRRWDPEWWEWRFFVAAGLLPLVPAPVKRPWRRFSRPLELAGWISPGLAGRVHLDDRVRASVRRAPAVRDFVVRESLIRLTSGEDATARYENERMGTHAGVELRHPFFDRRVVEFLLALPDALRFRDGLIKHILRVACRDVLPDLVAARRGKAELDRILVEHVRAASGGADWTRVRAVDAGWVEAARVAELRQEVETPGDATPPRVLAARAVWNLLGLEAWLRRVFP